MWKRHDFINLFPLHPFCRRITTHLAMYDFSLEFCGFETKFDRKSKEAKWRKFIFSNPDRFHFEKLATLLSDKQFIRRDELFHQFGVISNCWSAVASVQFNNYLVIAAVELPTIRNPARNILIHSEWRGLTVNVEIRYPIRVSLPTWNNASFNLNASYRKPINMMIII